MAIRHLSLKLLAVALLVCVICQDACCIAESSGFEGGRLYQARHFLSVNCPKLCAYRCSKSSRQKICIPDCNVCCKTCNCVPSGTAGNREECPCYAQLKNSKKTGKCP